MGIEPIASGLALQRSNHWATETPHLSHATTFNFVIIALPITSRLPDSPAAVIQSWGWLPSQILAQRILYLEESLFQGRNSWGARGACAPP